MKKLFATAMAGLFAATVGVSAFAADTAKAGAASTQPQASTSYKDDMAKCHKMSGAQRRSCEKDVKASHQKSTGK